MSERTAAEILNDSLMAFTERVGSALAVCSYGLINGDSYVPFDADPEDECPDLPEDDEAPDPESIACTQAWVRVSSVTIEDTEENFGGDSRGTGQIALDLEVGILRCFPMPDDGEAPTASDMLVSATQSMEDMHTIYCTAMDDSEGVPDLWETIDSGEWTPMGPLGMQVGGMWTFRVSGPCAPDLQE